MSIQVDNDICMLMISLSGRLIDVPASGNHVDDGIACNKALFTRAAKKSTTNAAQRVLSLINYFSFAAHLGGFACRPTCPPHVSPSPAAFQLPLLVRLRRALDPRRRRTSTHSTSKTSCVRDVRSRPPPPPECGVMSGRSLRRRGNGFPPG